MTESVVRCESVVRMFRTGDVEVPALRGLDLTVAENAAVALVGPPAAGKSTLLTILAGLDRPSGGAATVAGHDLVTMGRRERLRYLRRTVGVVWPDPFRNLLPYLTVAQNVAVPMMLAGRRGRRRRDRVDELLELLKVGHSRDHWVTDLTDGEKQRVAIATALANSPDLLLVDEPARWLHRAEAHEVLAAVAHANAVLGVTVIITSRDPTVAEHVQRTVLIRDGRPAGAPVDQR